MREELISVVKQREGKTECVDVSPDAVTKTKSEDCGSLVDERASFCVVMVFCSIKW